MKIKIYYMTKYFVLASSVFAIIINFIAVLLPLNGKTTQFLSDQYKVFFTPAGYVFSIWGLIYLGILLFSYYQIKNPASISNKTRYFFILSSFLNAAWIFAWHYEMVFLSVIIIVLLLVSLIIVYRETIHSNKIFQIRFPISLYLGWISVATIANTTVLLHTLNFNTQNINPETWTAIMIGVASLLGITMLIRHRDYIFNLVIIWAIIGIFVKWPNVLIILYTSVICIIFISIVAILKLLKKFEFQTPLDVKEF